MYDENVSFKNKKSAKAFTEACIAEYDRKNSHEDLPYSSAYEAEGKAVLESVMARENVAKRYNSFSETVRTALVTEAIYKLYDESVDEKYRPTNTERSIMRAIVNEFVSKIGYDTILNRMRTDSVALSEMHAAITSTTKTILEAVDKSNPVTFRIEPEMRDEFFKQLDYSDSEAINDAIKDRVATAMEDFVTANTKDHEDITATLQQAQDKIAEIPPEEESLREYYQGKATYEANKIRNRNKGVLHSMITATCEGTMKHQDTNSEFITEGKLDMDKIVNRTILMYSFLEMLNTTRMHKVDQPFIESIVKGLAE